MENTSNPIGIVGCGDVGRRVARRLIDAGRIVHGVVRSADSAQALRAEGLVPWQCDLDAAPPTLPPLSWLFWFAPPPAGGQADPRLRAFLATGPDVGRVIYISTSGVYGDCQGRWIDEDEPLKPQTDRARRRLDAEQALQAWRATGGKAVILRVPGIYGPGRLPERRLREQLPVIAEAESPWSNRVHAEDLAQAALRVAEHGADGAAYNVADGTPSTMTDYFLHCARHLGLPAPPQLPMADARRRLTPAMLSFADESKRLRIERLRALGYEPQFPTLASALPIRPDARRP